jgi:hypothetical protein
LKPDSDRGYGMRTVIELLKRAVGYLDIDGFSRGTQHDMVAAASEQIAAAIAELRAPRWYTPEQWEQRTGEPWPDNAAVYYRYVSAGGKLDIWRTGCYKNIANSNHDFRSHNAGYHQIVCATEAGPPPADWEPEEDKHGDENTANS